MNVIRLERPKAIVVSLGGQTAINLAEPLAALGVPIIGTDCEAIGMKTSRPSQMASTSSSLPLVCEGSGLLVRQNPRDGQLSVARDEVDGRSDRLRLMT